MQKKENSRKMNESLQIDSSSDSSSSETETETSDSEKNINSKEKQKPRKNDDWITLIYLLVTNIKIVIDIYNIYLILLKLSTLLQGNFFRLN